MPLYLKAFCLTIGIAFSGQLMSQNADDIIGIYLIDEGDSKVEIFRSDEGISGKVAWLEKEEKGLGVVLDDENPKESLRSQRVLGLVVFKGLKYKDGKWSGNIYSPRKGKYYDATFSINEGNGGLDLRIKIGFISVGRHWSLAS